MPQPGFDLSRYESRLGEAVKLFWWSREEQTSRQKDTGDTDRGSRSAVTGGKQMDGFISIFCDLIHESGLPQACVFRNRKVELPGYFRPTKQWDLVVVVDGILLAAIESKSQVGPSFGNNFNNRTEEAIGSAVDLWTAYREGALGKQTRPWLGYLFLLEQCSASTTPVKSNEPHFKVFPEFAGASYATRYELLCRKLIRERHYDAATFLLSEAQSGRKGLCGEPAEDLTFRTFLASLWAHVSSYAATRSKDA